MPSDGGDRLALAPEPLQHDGIIHFDLEDGAGGVVNPKVQVDLV
jgi:hypothetical protein